MTFEEWTREARLRARVAFQPWRRAPESVGWMVGSGRSGTTWLSSLLNADCTMREVFEPVHVLHVERMKGGATHPAYAEDPTWNAWLADVFRDVTSPEERTGTMWEETQQGHTSFS